MRVRTVLILEEKTLAKIDEIAGEKHRRARIIERALREYIARQEGKAPNPKKSAEKTKPQLAPAKNN